MKTEKVLIYVTAPILALGLKIQLESWGFTSIELITSCAQALASVKEQLPCLVVLDTELEEVEIDCFVLAQNLQAIDHPIPVIFMDKTLEELSVLSGHLKKSMPYPHTWVNKPCHSGELWQSVNNFLHI